MTMNRNTQFAGPFTEAEAVRLCTAAGMRKARLLDPEPDVLPQRRSDLEDDSSPMIDVPHVPQYPIPHTAVIGMPPADLYAHPERYGTRYLTAPFEGRVAGDFYFEVTAEMAALPAGTELIDGSDVPVTRVGTMRTADTFKVDDDPDVRAR